jgi:dTDP-4-amino-4,6-dideoxygalactose transaminase
MHVFSPGAARLFGSPAPYLVGFGPEIASLDLPYPKVIVGAGPSPAELKLSLAEEARSLGAQGYGLAEEAALFLSPDLFQLDSFPQWPVAVLEPSEEPRRLLLELFLEQLPKRIRDSLVRMPPGSDVSTLLHGAMRQHAAELFEQSVAAERALLELRQLHEEAQRALQMLERSAAQTTDWVAVMRPKLPRANELLRYIQSIDATRVYSNNGPLSDELERRLAALFRLPRGAVLCTGSGTAAIAAAILGSAGRARSERPFALLPAFTFVATASAVEQCGYCPYLADVDATTWMLDPDHLMTHPLIDRIGLVVPVAPFGRPVAQRPWQEFARKTGVPVVIDAAAGFEACIATPDDSLGELPVALSFHATKPFATGEGGAVVTTDMALAARVLAATNFGFNGSRDSQTPSMNGKMSEYHAAVGLAQLDRWLQTRAAFQALANGYRRLLDEAGLSQQFFGAPEVAGTYALFRCRSSNEAEAVRASLERSRIDFRLWYGGGLHRQSYYLDAARDALPVTEAVAPVLLGLPVAPDLPEASLRRVVAAIAEGVRAAK